MRVLLTGGYGCIGAWIVRQLLEREERVWVYDLKEDPRRLRLILPAEEIRRVGFLAGDVADFERLKSAIAGERISHVIHLAGLQVPVCRADPLLGARVNVLGTLAVLEAARQSAGQVQRVVYASSAAVFGPPENYAGERQPDDARLSPGTHYGVFKCCNEGNARIYFQDHGLPSVGLRPWTVYGVGRDFGMTSGPTRAIKALALGRPYHVGYGGRQDLQFVEDVAAAFVRCLDAPYTGAKSYNLRGAVVDVQEFHDTLARVDERARGLVTFGTQQIPIAYDLDGAALETDFGPLSHTPLLEGVRRTYDAFRRLHGEGRLDTDDL